jgi:hypothetical protein
MSYYDLSTHLTGRTFVYREERIKRITPPKRVSQAERIPLNVTENLRVLSLIKSTMRFPYPINRNDVYDDEQPLLHLHPIPSHEDFAPVPEECTTTPHNYYSDLFYRRSPSPPPINNDDNNKNVNNVNNNTSDSEDDDFQFGPAPSVEDQWSEEDHQARRAFEEERDARNKQPEDPTLMTDEEIEEAIRQEQNDSRQTQQLLPMDSPFIPLTDEQRQEFVFHGSQSDLKTLANPGRDLPTDEDDDDNADTTCLHWFTCSCF